VLSEPWVSRLIQSGSGHIWAKTQDLVPLALVGSVWYGPSLLEQNRDAGNQLMAAYLDGVRQYSEGATPRNIEIVSGFTGLDSAQLQATCWPVIRGDGRVNADRIREFQAWLVTRGDLSAEGRDTPIVDSSFTDWVARQPR
jgi:hypothetical protein